MLIRDHSSHSPKNRCRGGLAPAQVRRAIEAMEASLAAGVSLAELAATAGLSTPHFCRAFRQSTGLPPHRYQIALRIERAQQRLALGRESVADVAAAVGYGDPAYFSRLFRDQVGVSPSAWRRLHRV
jgi:transcriptional regulator GlxA family with amidase domain